MEEESSLNNLFLLTKPTCACGQLELEMFWQKNGLDLFIYLFMNAKESFHKE